MWWKIFCDKSFPIDQLCWDEGDKLASWAQRISTGDRHAAYTFPIAAHGGDTTNISLTWRRASQKKKEEGEGEKGVVAAKWKEKTMQRAWCSIEDCSGSPADPAEEELSCRGKMPRA